MNNTDSLPLPNDDMPPLPGAGEKGFQVCASVSLHLAILDDLPPEKVQLILEHVRECPKCAAVQRQVQRTTRLLADLPASAPSSRVDQAVMAAIASRGSRQVSPSAAGSRSNTPTLTPRYPRRERKRGRGIVGIPYLTGRVPLAVAMTFVLAAGFIFAFLTTQHFIESSTTQAFALPPGLSWNGYVLYHSETRINASGERYHIDSYHDLASGRMHVETVMAGSLDVVAVGDDHAMLGLDMMHHVAQWGADAWSVDETPFDLAQLRGDMQAHRAVYLGQDMFHSQPVYRIRTRNGLVLLLDMNYRPVNVLRGAIGTGTGEPVYDTLTLMPASHMSSSMWDMNIPAGFQMGTLPKKP